MNLEICDMVSEICAADLPHPIYWVVASQSCLKTGIEAKNMIAFLEWSGILRKLARGGEGHVCAKNEAASM